MQVRVFDVNTASANPVSDRLETEYSAKQSCIKVLRCHEERVKRIITEDSPDLFLSVSEVSDSEDDLKMILTDIILHYLNS
jgi:hypothetical protein